MDLKKILLASLVSAPLFFGIGYFSHDKIEDYLRRDKDSYWIGYEELEKDAERILGIGDSPSMDPVWDGMPLYQGETDQFYSDGMEDLKACETRRRYIM